jgi:hypothetical protein
MKVFKLSKISSNIIKLAEPYYGIVDERASDVMLV